MSVMKMFRRWRARRAIKKARWLVRKIDLMSKRAGLRWAERRPMWASFIKSSDNHEAILGFFSFNLKKEIERRES